MAGLWQQQRGQQLGAVLLCGDVGAFSAEERMDHASLRHARHNPFELEALRNWMSSQPAPWLRGLFAAAEDGGLGLDCPVVMVHGNHEDFPLLQGLGEFAPGQQLELETLPRVDPGGHLRYLPSGCRVEIGGWLVGGLGGIEPGQRVSADYHPWAYLQPQAVQAIAHGPRLDLLLTHQGPARLQGSPAGSQLLDRLLEGGRAPRVWCHGHSVRHDQLELVGAGQVVPLHGVAFHEREPGRDAWCWLDPGDPPMLQRGRPGGWEQLRSTEWLTLPDGRQVAPPLLNWL